MLVCLLLRQACADTLSQQIDALLSAPELARGIQGVIVKSLDSGATLYEHNPDTAEIPASNTKLLTAATALDQLGAGFTYTTKVYLCGKLRQNGTLNGSIILKGGGDPALEPEDLDAMAVQIRHLGIRKVTGSLIVDDTMFDNIRLGEGWAWDYLSDYYAAEISALNAHRNVVDVSITPGKTAGAKASVLLTPPTSYVTICNKTTTALPNTNSSITIARDMCSNLITVSGAIALGSAPTKPEGIAIRNPQLYVGSVFYDALARRGVSIAGKVVKGTLPRDAKPAISHTSPPLTEILKLFLKPSDNLIGEVLLKTVGYVKRGRGSTSAGLEAENEFLKRAGVDTSAVSIVDGSGLSRLNLATPRSVMTLLAYMSSRNDANVFIDALPIAGVDGTLRNRMKDTPAQGNVHAKTGTVRYASCLSGYVTTASGEHLVFSIMMNNHTDNTAARRVQDQICELLALLS